MKYIVTGGAGFIGSHLVDALIAMDHDVIIVDNLLSGKTQNMNKRASRTFLEHSVPNSYSRR